MKSILPRNNISVEFGAMLSVSMVWCLSRGRTCQRNLPDTRERRLLQAAYLYQLGAEEMLLDVFDGLPGLEAAMKEIYPKTDVNVALCIKFTMR